MMWISIIAKLKSKDNEEPIDKSRLILKYIYNLHETNPNKKFKIKNQANCDAKGFLEKKKINI